MLQCRKLLAWLASPSDPTELPAVEELLRQAGDGSQQQQELEKPQEQEQQQRGQQEQEQGQKEQRQQQQGQQRNSGTSSSEELAGASLPAVQPAAPLSAKEAAELCRRLERLVPRHSPTSGALNKLLRSNQNGRPAAVREANQAQSQPSVGCLLSARGVTAALLLLCCRPEAHPWHLRFSKPAM